MGGWAGINVGVGLSSMWGIWLQALNLRMIALPVWSGLMRIRSVWKLHAPVVAGDRLVTVLARSLHLERNSTARS